MSVFVSIWSDWQFVKYNEGSFRPNYSACLSVHRRGEIPNEKQDTKESEKM